MYFCELKSRFRHSRFVHIKTLKQKIGFYLSILNNKQKKPNSVDLS